MIRRRRSPFRKACGINLHPMAAAVEIYKWTEKKIRKKVFKEINGRKPIRPLPAKRPRRLSIPLPLAPTKTILHRHKQVALDQEQSIFFTRLPAEIINKIYSYVFTGHRIHLFPRSQKYNHRKCGQAEKDLCWKPMCSVDRKCPMVYERLGCVHGATHYNFEEAAEFTPRHSLLAFALSCHLAFVILKCVIPSYIC